MTAHEAYANAGKGDSPRKQQDQKAYEEGWDRIFGNSNKQKVDDENRNRHRNIAGSQDDPPSSN